MGGESKKSETQNSTTSPWEPATPALKGILGQVNQNLGNTALTGAEGGALDTLQNNGQSFSSTYAPQFASFAKDLLGGGGAMNEAGAVNANYKRYVDQTNPLASNTNYNPYETPGFKDALNTMTSDITSGVNGQFAAGGRGFSGMNSQTLGRGLAQGLAPVIASQYNQNVNNQQGAAGNLYNAGNTNAGLLSGMNQTRLGNQAQGVTAAGAAGDAQNVGANSVMQAEAQRRSIPVQALGLLAQIGIPIAGLGGQSTGKSDSTQQMSGAQQFGTIMQGFGSIMPKGPISFG